MPMLTLSAHYDGEKICLDEAYKLKPNTKLIVTILSEQEMEQEYESWVSFSGDCIEKAYGDKEPEYTLNLIREENPAYEGR